MHYTNPIQRDFEIDIDIIIPKYSGAPQQLDLYLAKGSSNEDEVYPSRAPLMIEQGDDFEEEKDGQANRQDEDHREDEPGNRQAEELVERFSDIRMSEPEAPEPEALEPPVAPHAQFDSLLDICNDNKDVQNLLKAILAGNLSNEQIQEQLERVSKQDVSSQVQVDSDSSDDEDDKQ
ncbi:hypothetical protein FGO68_gene5274 [Halteria grandinella]|uniref:Uncharacterized protein n=1 Tax=Halteria grandinella TaxID=5974 RepID=A0A8J8T0M5_HALGN|nr:hypothetical protein FGO68_gene5274 [Halteria grandinella]